MVNRPRSSLLAYGEYGAEIRRYMHAASLPGRDVGSDVVVVHGPQRLLGQVAHHSWAVSHLKLERILEAREYPVPSGFGPNLAETMY
jgi:hypothetical protein